MKQELKESKAKIADLEVTQGIPKEEFDTRVNDAIEQKEKEHEAMISEKVQEYEESLKLKEEEFQSQLSIKEEEYVLKLKEKEDELSETVSKLRQNMDEQTIKLQEEHNSTLEIKEKEFQEEIQRIQNSKSLHNNVESNVKFIELEKEIMELKDNISELESQNAEFKEQLQKSKANHEKEIKDLKENIGSTLRGGEAEILTKKNQNLEEHIVKIKIAHMEEIDYLNSEIEQWQSDYDMALDKLEIISKDRDNLIKILDKLK